MTLDISNSSVVLLNTPKGKRDCPIPNHSPKLPFTGKIDVATHSRAHQARLSRLDSMRLPEADERPAREHSAPGRMSLSPRSTLTASGGLLSQTMTAIAKTPSPTHRDFQQQQLQNFQRGPQLPTSTPKTSPPPNPNSTQPPEPQKVPKKSASSQPHSNELVLLPPTNSQRAEPPSTSPSNRREEWSKEFAQSNLTQTRPSLRSLPILPNKSEAAPRPELRITPPTELPTRSSPTPLNRAESSPEGSPNAPRMRTRAGDQPKEATTTTPTHLLQAAGGIAEERKAPNGNQHARPSGIPAPAGRNQTTTAETTKRGNMHP